MREDPLMKLINCDLEGYITVVDRSKDYHVRTTHIYRGTFSEPEEGLCRYSPDSFFRNNFNGEFCKLCVKNLLKEINLKSNLLTQKP